MSPTFILEPHEYVASVGGKEQKPLDFHRPRIDLSKANIMGLKNMKEKKNLQDQRALSILYFFWS